MEHTIARERMTLLHEAPEKKGPVVYWMQRDLRAEDNYALLFAQQRALASGVPLLVVFCLSENFLGAAYRQFSFMLKGIGETAEALAEKKISFHLLQGEPSVQVALFLEKTDAGYLVCDFNPLRIVRRWKEELLKKINIPACEIDAHNIVPCRAASPKREYGAYTLRPKLKALLPLYFHDMPKLKKMPDYSLDFRMPDIAEILANHPCDRSVAEVAGIRAGSKAGKAVLRKFIAHNLSRYALKSNDPVEDVQSHLSPYLHFGFISPQRAALDVEFSGAPRDAVDAFLEQLIIRRELSDNFCFYDAEYDNPACFPDWGKRTLHKHREDPREYLYDQAAFEMAQTHDLLWNAAQRQLVESGTIHGYMRMYWAKKILEWSASAESAHHTAVYLNDRYALDGRDPNGYAGIAWSMGGVHDRAWGERGVFGSVRYMNYNGCRSKFDVHEYIRRWSVL